MKKKAPSSPLPPKIARGLSRYTYVFTDSVIKAMPELKLDLLQAKMDVDVREFVAITITNAAFYFILFGLLFIFLGIVLRIDLFPINILLSMAMAVFAFFSSLYRPKIVIRRRMRELEKNLIPALRHLLIEVRSGVPLFNAMAGITSGYGEVSEEFKHVITDINAGAKVVQALNSLIKRNPSFAFRRAIWQISNALTSGADVGDALQAIIEDLTKAQVTAIRRYGQELNPWTMIYMVAAVIVPSLGVTFLVVISAFSGAIIPKIIYPLIAAELLGFQLFFMNFVKSKRPAV
jgi:flagellar protein FlaJ